MNEKERNLRQKSNYLKSVYKYSNYDNYVLISTDENQIKFSDMGGVWHHNIIRERTNFDRTFYSKNKISVKALRKELIGDILYYRPGILHNEDLFIEQPLDFKEFSLLEISENISSINLQKPRLSIKIKAFKKDSFKEYPVSVLNNEKDEIEKLENQYPWYQNTMVEKLLSVKGYNIFSTDNILKTIQNYIISGFDIEKISKQIEPFKEPKPNTTPLIVFDFINSLKFRSWSEISNRVGKDNLISGGNIIEGFEIDKYIIKLIEKNTEYRLTSDNRLKSYNDTDYGYIRSNPYKESELYTDESLKQRLLTILIKNYNAYENYLINLET